MLVCVYIIRRDWAVVASSKVLQEPGEAAEPKTLIKRGRDTHILRLPPGRVVTFTKLYEWHEHKSIEIVLDIPEENAPAIVDDALLSTSLWCLLLLLLFDLGGLRLDFAGTGEGSVNWPSKKRQSASPSMLSHCRAK